MANFTINFFVPISIDYVINTPLFYKTEEENKGDNSGVKPNEQVGVDKDQVVTIYDMYEKARVDNIPDFINNLNDKIEKYRKPKEGEKELHWEEWSIDLGLDYPYKITYGEPIISSEVKLDKISLLSLEDYSPCKLDNEEVRFFIHANGTAFVNYIARFSGEYGVATKEDIAQKVKDIYENIEHKFTGKIPILSERAKEVKYALQEYIKEKFSGEIKGKFFVECDKQLSELFPWQYVVFHMDKTYKLSDDQKALLLHDKEAKTDYSTHKNWEIYFAWKAAVIIPQEPHEIFEKLPQGKLPHIILPHDYFCEILCSLWMELLLIQKLLTIESTRLLLMDRKTMKEDDLTAMRHMRVISEGVLSKLRAFRIQYQIEFVRLVEVICNKWLITEHLIQAIRNRSETINRIYENAKDTRNDQRQKYFSAVAMFFTVFSFLAVVTAITCFIVTESEIPSYARGWTLGVSIVIALGFLAWVIRWVRR